MVALSVPVIFIPGTFFLYHNAIRVSVDGHQLSRVGQLLGLVVDYPVIMPLHVSGAGNKVYHGNGAGGIASLPVEYEQGHARDIGRGRRDSPPWVARS